MTYSDVRGCKEQIGKLREVVETPLLHVSLWLTRQAKPSARAVANRTDANFICIIGSELIQKYVNEDARMVQELFKLVQLKRACINFSNEVNAISRAWFDKGAGGDNEVQRMMLELITQMGWVQSKFSW